MPCSKKFKQWREDNQLSDYPVIPVNQFGSNNLIITYLADGGMEIKIGTADPEDYLTYEHEGTNSFYQRLNFKNVSEIHVIVYNQTAEALTFSLKDYHLNNLIEPVTVNAGGGLSRPITYSQDMDGLEWPYNPNGLTRSGRFRHDGSTHDITLKEIITDSPLVTDEESDFFSLYYDNWCIVDPYNDFVSELKMSFLLARDRLTAYKEQLDDFSPDAKTVMDVEYGERNVEGKDYEYPLDSETVTPNRKSNSKQESFTDTTTVRKNDEPFKNLDKTKDLDGWLKFFVKQFEDCFTLIQGMTW